MATDRIEAVPEVKPDPTKPDENVNVEVRTGIGGKTQVIATAPAPKSEEPAAERPTWLPEKFKSPDDLMTATVELLRKQGTTGEPMLEFFKKQGASEDTASMYAGLEKEFGRAGQQKGEDKPKDEPKKDADPALLLEMGTREQVADALKGKGFDYAALTAEFNAHGNLTPETLKKLEDGGVTKAQIDGYIERGRREAAAAMDSVFKVAGGSPEAYDTLTKWAGTNLSKDEIAAYNKAMESGDQGTILFAVKGLHARYEATEGREPKLIGGSTPPGGDLGDAYGSMQEAAAVVRDPRYKADPGFREKHYAKLKRSRI